MAQFSAIADILVLVYVVVKKEIVQKMGEYCDQVYSGTLLTTAAGALSGNFKKEWFGKCRPNKEDGEPTFYAQVGCGDNNDYAEPCRSKWACGGFCSCNPDDKPCDSEKYCDWQNEKKCVEKLDDGEATERHKLDVVIIQVLLENVKVIGLVVVIVVVILMIRNAGMMNIVIGRVKRNVLKN